MNKTYERFKQAYIDLILSERVENMPDRIVSFDRIEFELKIIFKSLKTLVDKGYDSIKYCWSVGSEAQFKGDRLNIIFEQNSLEKDTLASFNPLNNPFELCINMGVLGKTCSKQDMLKFIESEDFYVLLAHEMCHYRQTFLHGVSVMKDYVAMENEGRYFDSAIELEACVFMVVEDSVLKGKKARKRRASVCASPSCGCRRAAGRRSRRPRRRRCVRSRRRRCRRRSRALRPRCSGVRRR